jgi:RND family efflux transporter MFP subunit
MSRKSGFSNRFSLKGPSVEGELPHHPKALGRSCRQQVWLGSLRGEFANPDRRLWPGQFVDVVLTLADQPNTIVVPSQAIQNGQQGQFVFVVRPDMTVETRAVTVSRSSDGQAVVDKGLAPGEQVVTDGQLRLVPGAKVELKQAAVAPSATGSTGTAQNSQNPRARGE